MKYRSKLPLVNPVRNSTFSAAVAIALATLFVNDMRAQQPGVTRSVRNQESAARASWSPTRNRPSQQQATEAAQVGHNLVPAKVRQASHHTHKQPVANRQTQRTHQHAANNGTTRKHSTARQHGTANRHGTASRPSAVRQAQHISGSLPAPARPVGSVITSGPIVTHGPLIDAPVVDGGIYHEGPVTTYPLDGQIVHGGGGCDVAGCDGSCGAGGGCDAGPTCGVGGPSCGVEDCGGCAGGCTSCKTSCGGGCSMCGELVSPQAWRPAITLQLPQDGWLQVEALHWWQDGLSLPPLVTTNDGDNIAREDAGVLGRSTTRTLFGGNSVLDNSTDGIRVRFGTWLDRCHSWGVGGEYFSIGEESEDFASTSAGAPVLARPFFNTQTGLNDSELVAFPGVVTGTVTARATSQLRGGGFHFRRLRCCQEGCKSWLFCGCSGHFCSRSETSVGYRFMQLDESVTINEDLIGDAPNPGTFDITDSFRTRNQFNGLDLGWKHRVTRGYWTYDASLRLAFGTTLQTVRIDGSTTINDPANPPATTDAGGLLTQTSNIGVFKQNEFAVVPEFNMNIGYQLTDHLRATAGYTFIYWSNVVRPGDQIDLDLNPNLLPPQANQLVGVNRPEFAFRTTDYWVQGLSYGLEYRW